MTQTHRGRWPCDDAVSDELCSYKPGKADDHQKLRQESMILPRILVV